MFWQTLCVKCGEGSRRKVRRYESLTVERDRDLSEVFECIYPILSTLCLLETQTNCCF